VSDLANHRIDALEKAQTANVAYQREVMGILRGSNGDLGLLHTVDAIDTRLETVEEKLDGLKASSSGLKESIDALRQERRADNDKRTGAKDAIGWIRWSLQLLAIVVSLAVGFTALQANFATVSQQLNRIPNLPE